MATSLTTNNLTLNHGSIVDVYNDRSAVLVVSLNRSYTGTIGGIRGWGKGENLTLSGNVGDVVTGVAWYRTTDSLCEYSVSASGGYWMMSYTQYDNSVSVGAGVTFNVTTNLNYVLSTGTLVSYGISKKFHYNSYDDEGSSSSYAISGVAVIAIRVA